jgi:hypothetical protein
VRSPKSAERVGAELLAAIKEGRDTFPIAEYERLRGRKLR